MIDGQELEARVERLRGSRPTDEALREAVMAIELTASGQGDAVMRCGVASISARCVVELLGLERFVEAAGTRRELAGARREPARPREREVIARG